MIELALHILDIAENSSRAQASLIEIALVEDLEKDILSLEIKDNGSGMDEETMKKAMDPFYTSKKVRRVGLGLPMLKHAALSAGGDFSIESKLGVGTRICASFQHSHIDRQPIGDIPGTVIALIIGNPEIDILYTHKKNSREYVLDTREIRTALGDIPLNHMEVLNVIKDNVIEGIGELNL
ncbi:MAG TPA: ATP-binding protein [Deltaproteobacteria bacterium]|nr:ATP-binding protein [Deltaproteobacteria bacterium]